MQSSFILIRLTSVFHSKIRKYVLYIYLAPKLCSHFYVMFATICDINDILYIRVVIHVN